MDAQNPEGFTREWKLINSMPEKNLGYAVQWFSMAFLVCLIYFILLFRWLLKRKK
jgi:surfeit locus 1 family protein